MNYKKFYYTIQSTIDSIQDECSLKVNNSFFYYL